MDNIVALIVLVVGNIISSIVVEKITRLWCKKTIVELPFFYIDLKKSIVYI